jgi:hypothetical protein
MDITPPEGNIGLPRGIADADGAMGFVSGGGGVERLDLWTGRQVWGTDLVRYPIALWRARLLAFRTVAARPAELQVVALDIDRPEAPLFSSDPIPMPAWAPPSRKDLHIDASIHGSELTLRWAAEKHYEGGAPPSREIELAAARSTIGAARVSLDTGAVDVGGAPRPVRKPSAELADFREGEWRSEPWTAGADHVQLVQSEVEGRQRLSIQLESAEAPGSSDRVVIAEGTALATVVSLDGAHVVVRNEASQGPEQATVFSIPRRQPVGTMTWEPGADEIVVLSDRVLYLVRQVERAATAQSLGASVTLLKARELRTDRLLWEHPLEREQTGPRRVRP